MQLVIETRHAIHEKDRHDMMKTSGLCIHMSGNPPLRLRCCCHHLWSEARER